VSLDWHGDIELASGAEVVLEAWQSGWTAPDSLTLTQWSDTYRQLPTESAAEAGDWRTSRTPFLRAIMEDLSVDSPVTEVTLLKSTQVGGTEVGINLIGYVADHVPGPMMYVLPTVDVARRFSEQRLKPMIELMPCLQRRFGPSRSRDSGNTALTKKFPGGLLVLSGANSASSLASMPVRYLVLDELDKYPRDLDKQGSAQVQAERRTSSYTRRKKIFKVSSPSVKDSSAIDDEYERGSQAEYRVPCPYCGTRHALDIDNLTDDGLFVCPACGDLYGEEHKTAMLVEAVSEEEPGAWWVHRYPERLAKSYAIWAGYSPVGLGYTWKEIAAMRTEAQGDIEKEVVFTNTILGRSYEGVAQKVEAKDVKDRAGKWQRRTIPAGCMLITVGIDVQANRFAIGVWGWGRNEQCWAIDYVELPGDPTRNEDWAVVDEFLDKATFVNAFGTPLRPAAVCIDSGNWTNDVYRWVRPRQARNIMAIKGMNTPDAPAMARPKKEDANRKGGADRRGIARWNVGQHTIKTTLMQRLINDGELADEERRRFHFPADHDPEFYQMLTAERLDLVAKRWVLAKGKRNEVLDTLVYAYAAALSPKVRLHVMRDADWSVLEAKLEPGTPDLWSVPPAIEPMASPAPAPTPTVQKDAAERSEGAEAPDAPAPAVMRRAQTPAAPRRGGSQFARRT